MLPGSVGRRAALFCLAFGIVVQATPALAEPPAWGMWQVLRERYHRPNDFGDEDYRVVYATQPRVAAIAMTDDGPVVVARGLPYGFNRGTCDRQRIAPADHDGPLAVGLAVEGSDRDCIIGALDHLPDQRAIAWAGESGELLRVEPERTYHAAGLLCRDYSASMQVGERRQQTFGTACRRPDGQWEILD